MTNLIIRAVTVAVLAAAGVYAVIALTGAVR